jgi:HNH endonuclease
MDSEADITRRKAQARKLGHANYKGTKWITAHGYLGLTPALDDGIGRAMHKLGGQVLEHRLVMAHHLGRPLERGEVVHHINGIRTDNRLENLKLFGSDVEHKRYIHYAECPHCGGSLR